MERRGGGGVVGSYFLQIPFGTDRKYCCRKIEIQHCLRKGEGGRGRIPLIMARIVNCRGGGGGGCNLLFLFFFSSDSFIKNSPRKKLAPVFEV